ncbi:MAG: ubiquitin-like domain-containing protein [Bacilli bacterium]
MVHLPQYATALRKHKKSFLTLGGVILASTALTTTAMQTASNEALASSTTQTSIFQNQAKTVQDLLNNNPLQPDGRFLFMSDETEENAPKIRLTTIDDVELHVDGKVISVPSAAVTVGEFLKEQNIELGEYDTITPKLDTPIVGNLTVQIRRGVDVAFLQGTSSKMITTSAETVGQLLAEQGIAVDVDDKIEPSIDTLIEPGMKITFKNVEQSVMSKTETVPYKTVIKKDASLEAGKKKTSVKGKNGVAINQYEIIKENGKIISKKLVESNVTTKPVDEVVIQGTKKAIVKDVGIMEVGQEYVVEATAYSPFCNGCSGITAGNINIRENPNMKVIAVDPRYIKLGTKVYVEGYGVAIAGDTGGAIKGKRIDILVPTEKAAYNWGRRNVKIRILG